MIGTLLSSHQETSGARVGRYRWVVAALLFVANAINYLDRSALSIAAPLVTRDLHLDPASLGLVFSAFFVGYAVFCFVGGWASDWLGPKIVFAVAMLWWSVFCGATVLATGFFSLLTIRVLFGLGEGPMGSTSNKTVSNWFPREEAGTTVGFYLAGNSAGAAIAGPIVGLLAVAYGWRVAFLVITLLGLLWVGFWWVLVADTPAKSRWVKPAERAFITRSRSGEAVNDRSGESLGSLRQWLLSPAILCIALAFFAASYVLYFLLTWMPTYLTSVHHLDLHRMSLMTVIPWTCGGVGLLAGGAASDWLLRRLGDSVRARKIVLVVSLCMAAASMVGAARSQSLGVSLGLLATALFFVQVAPLNCFVLIQELVPGHSVGKVGGYVHLLANLAGIIGPALTGFMVKYYGGFGISFTLAGALALLGALAVLLGVSRRSVLHG